MVGTVFVEAMKGSGIAIAAKDPMVEAVILMADVVGRIAMRPIGDLTASLREGWVKSCRSGARGDEYGAW